MSLRRLRLYLRLRSLRRNPRTAVYILAAASVASVLAVLWFGRGTTFSGDEAVWVAATPGIDLRTVFEPHGGHLLTLTRLVYWPLLEIFGLAYLPFRLLAITATLLTVWLLFIYGRRRTDHLVALAPCLVLLFFGSDYLHLFQGNGFTVMLSLALGVAALLSLDADSKRGDLLACLWLTIGVFTYSVILPFVAGAAVLILVGRRGVRSLWIVAVPFAVYAVWRGWLFLDGAGAGGGGVALSSLLLIPAWSFQSLSAVLNSLTGLSYSFAGANQSTPLELAGPPLALLSLVAFSWIVSTRGLRLGVLVTSVVLLALFTLQVLASDSAAELRVPGDARYMYPGAVAFVLVAFELARRWRPGLYTLVALALITLSGVATNLTLMRDNAGFVRESGRELRTLVGATELALDGDRSRVAPLPPEQSTIGENPAFALRGMALQGYGQFGYGPDELNRQPPARRESADLLLVTTAMLGLAGAGELPAPARCRLLADGDGGTVSFEAPAGRLLLESAQGGQVRVGRFADLAGVPVGDLEPAEVSSLGLPADSAPDPWKVAFDGPKLKVCS